MANKHTKAEIIDRLINGGPRQKTSAWGPAHELVRNGELNPREELPDPKKIDNEMTKRHVHELTTQYDIRNERTDDLIEALADETQAERLLQTYGNSVNSVDCQSQLMGTVESYLQSENDNLAVMATYPLVRWAPQNNAPPYNTDILLEALSDNRGVVKHGRKEVVGESIKSVLRLLLLNEHISNIDTLVESINTLLASKDSKTRERAGYLAAFSRDNENELLELLIHKNTAVRRGAISGFAHLKLIQQDVPQELRKTPQVIAQGLLREYWEIPNRLLRFAIAESVIQQLVFKPYNKMSKLVSKNRRSLFAKDDADVLAALANFYQLSLNVEDCRMVAPLLAMLLSEKEREIRLRASNALYMINDHQSSLPILKASVSVVSEALKKESDPEVKESLKTIRISSS